MPLQPHASGCGSLFLDHLDELGREAEVLVLLDGLELLDVLNAVAVLAEGDDLLKEDLRTERPEKG